MKLKEWIIKETRKSFDKTDLKLLSVLGLFLLFVMIYILIFGA